MRVAGFSVVALRCSLAARGARHKINKIQCHRTFSLQNTLQQVYNNSASIGFPLYPTLELNPERLTEMFKSLDVDGNGTIDFEEFKAGVKREPLLVRAFLAPVQQGSLLSAPVTRRSTLRPPTSGPTPSSKHKEGKVSKHASGNSPGESLVEGMGKSERVSKESMAGYRQAPNDNERGERLGDRSPGNVDAYDAEMLPDLSASESTRARQMRALSTHAEFSTLSTAGTSRDMRDSGRGNPCDDAETEKER